MYFIPYSLERSVWGCYTLCLHASFY